MAPMVVYQLSWGRCLKKGLNINEIMRKENRGNRIMAKITPLGIMLPFHQIELLRIHCLPASINSDDERQANGCLGSSDHHNENNKDLSGN